MQQRLTLFIAALIGIVVIAVAITLQPTGLSEAQVSALIDRKVEEQVAIIRQDIEKQLPQPVAEPAVPSAPSSESADLGPIIETYLMDNPEILQRMSDALQAKTELAQAEQTKLALTSLSGPIYDDPDHVILGNPEGDVTIVEFFDYNCSFCRQALADVLQLLDEDKNLRIILKEFPILSQGSADAARIGIVVGRNKDINYLDFHTAVYATRGQVDKQAALNAAASLGLNPIEVELAMGDDSVTQAITRTYQLAEAINVTSTPNFIIGDELLRGAVGIEEMKSKIANMRECGKATCNL